MVDLNRTILPKIEFLHTIGVSRGVLAQIIAKNPRLLIGSLKQCVMPFYDVLKSVLSDDEVIKTLQRLRSFSLSPAKKNMAVNISILKGLGVPERTISLVLITNPADLCFKVEKFKRDVKEIIEMEFNPETYTFVNALGAKLRMSPENWETKIDVIKKWGLSEDQFWSAFKKHQRWVTLSVETIMKKIDFLVNKMGWRPDDVIKNRAVLGYSLEKRIVPRCSVIRILLLKGLINNEISLYSIILCSEEQFLNLYVRKHLGEEPRLLDVLHRKMEMGELGFEFNEKSKASLL